MFCKNCGATLEDNDAFCKNCGAPVQASAPVVEQPVQEPVAEQSVQENIVEQPVQPVQQPVQQVPPQQKTQQQGPKKNNTVLIVCLCAAAAFFIMIIIVAVVVLNILSNAIDGVDKGDSTPTTVVDKNKDDDKATTTSSKKSNTYKVSFGGFDFRVPDNFVYEKDDEYLYIGDEDETWIAMICPEEASYSQVKQYKEELAESYEEDGVKVESTNVKTLGGIEYVYYEMSQSGENIILAVARANSMNIFTIMAFNVDNEYDESILKEIAPIIESAEYTGEDISKNMESNISIDTSKFSNYVEK